MPNGIDAGLVSLAMMAKFWGKAADAGDIKHQLGKGDKPLTIQDILLAAKSLDLTAKTISATGDKLANTPLPAIAQTKSDQFFIIAHRHRLSAIKHASRIITVEDGEITE